ncbi:2'-5' RNA ligase [Salmonella bongori]|nr:2'-5' RNA ligase [Salmonella bongori]
MSEPKRLFFAIDLPCETREQIIAWRATHFASEAGRPVAAANLHLTLAFLGDVSDDKQRALAQLAGRIRQPGFTLHLNDAGPVVALTGRVAGNAPVAARIVAVGQYASRAGCP